MALPRFPKLGAALRFASQHRLKELLAVAVGFGSFGFGLSLIIDPNAYDRSDTYSVAFSWAPAQTWGTLLVFASVVLGLTMWINRQQGMWPALGLMMLYGFLTMATVFTAYSTGVPASVWMHFTLCLVSAILTAGCAFHDESEEHRHA